MISGWLLLIDINKIKEQCEKIHSRIQIHASHSPYNAVCGTRSTAISARNEIQWIFERMFTSCMDNRSAPYHSLSRTGSTNFGFQTMTNMIKTLQCHYTLMHIDRSASCCKVQECADIMTMNTNYGFIVLEIIITTLVSKLHILGTWITITTSTTWSWQSNWSTLNRWLKVQRSWNCYGDCRGSEFRYWISSRFP